MIEEADTLYRWTPREPSEYKPQGRIETPVWDVSNCINKDSWKLRAAQQGISDFYDTYSSQTSYGKSDEQWVLEGLEMTMPKNMKRKTEMWGNLQFQKSAENKDYYFVLSNSNLKAFQMFLQHKINPLF